MELIDKKHLLDGICDMFCDRPYIVNITKEVCRKAPCGLKEIINNEPVIDAVPVVRGHWKEDDGRVRVCSVCDTDWRHKDEMDFEQYFNFCPNCGADMRGEYR